MTNSSNGNEPSDASRSKRGQGTKVDRNIGINVVHDLDFVPEDKGVSLRPFFERKVTQKPTTSKSQSLLTFLSIFFGLNSFGPGHILTAFKHVGKRVPADIRATVRNLKMKAWLNYSNSDQIVIATEGENVVDHQLPKGNSQ